MKVLDKEKETPPKRATHETMRKANHPPVQSQEAVSQTHAFVHAQTYYNNCNEKLT